jgi:hypothetical protein
MLSFFSRLCVVLSPRSCSLLPGAPPSGGIRRSAVRALGCSFDVRDFAFIGNGA